MKSRTALSKMLSIFTAAMLLVTLPSLVPTHTVSAAGIAGTISHPGFLPTALALDPSRNRLFVFDQTTHAVYVYNASTFQELGNIPTSLPKSYSMVVDESLGKLYVAFSDPGVSVTEGIAVIDIPTMTLLKYLPSGGFTLLRNDEERDLVYASSNGSVRQINAATDVQTSIAGITGNLYTSMAVNPVTHELFVANWSQNDGNFFVVNPTTLALTTIPNMNGFGVAVNWTENKAYVNYCQSAGYEAVCIYDRDTGSVTRIYTGNDTSEPLVFNSLVNRMYSNTEINAVATIFNGADNSYTNIPMQAGMSTVGVRNSTDNVYYVDDSGTYVMKGSTGKIIADFHVGVDCSGLCDGDIVINQASGLVYIINEFSTGVVTIIQDGEFTLECPVTSLPGAGAYPGELTSADCHSPIRNAATYWPAYYADRYSFTGTAGQTVNISLDGGSASEYLYLIGPAGTVLAEAGGTYWAPAVIPSSGSYTLPVSGTYVIEATSSYSSDAQWSYTLTFNKGLQQTFVDVPPTHLYYQDIEILYANGLTSGCATNPLKYCPDQIMNRGQAAVFMLKGNFGSGYLPAPAQHIFKDDWTKGPWAEPWAEAMRKEGLSAGCLASPLKYCPWDQIPREQAVIFALRLKYGTLYTPPPATGMLFADMTNPGYYATSWAEQAYKDGIIPNCGMSGGKPKFCPKDLVSRGLAAYMIVRAKSLTMP